MEDRRFRIGQRAEEKDRTAAVSGMRRTMPCAGGAQGV